jgi:H+/Cl- antiporter ClcA
MLVALAGLVSDGTVFGTGYIQAKMVLDGFQMPWLFGPLKLVATALSSVSGIPGGLFSPSLSVGAGLGYDLAPLFPQVPIGVLAILCMAAYLSGVVQSPLTSAVIVSEMTADHALIFPIMICALAAAAISHFIYPDGVYHALAHRILEKRQAPELPEGERAES